LLTVFSQWPVLPKHCLQEADPESLQQDAFWKNPVGSGTYKVAEAEPGKPYVLERWDGYRESGEGNIEKIVMRPSGETDGNLVALAQRDLLDYAWGKSTDDALCMKAVEGMTVTEVDASYTRCFFVNQFAHESGVAKRAAQASAEPTENPTENQTEAPTE
jgi:peptide/nickel transport system substrate-binding protein